MDSQKTKAAGKTLSCVLLPILTGLVLSQIVATIAVHQSNLRIWALAKAISTEGYLSIPTGPAMQTLTQLSTALWGGLFFTLSIGTGLTLTTWAAMTLWCRIMRRDPKILIGYGAAWVCLLIMMNVDGAAWLPTLFCLLVPPATAYMTIRGLPKRHRRPTMLNAVPLGTLILLTAIWATQLNQDLFISIRDHVLLSNTIGHKVNDFYYRNTLYAAEVFKSFNQKTIRTYRWAGTPDTDLGNRIENRLVRHDVIRLEKKASTDLALTHHDGKLVMTANDGRRLETTVAEFTAAIPEWLKQYSELTDRWGPFRRATLYGLLFGFPILLFVFVYAALRMATGLFLMERQAVLCASGICLAIGIMLFLPMRSVRPAQITETNLASALVSNSWPERVGALRHIEKEKIDIARYPEYRTLVASPLVVERYWLARAMSTSRSLSTYYNLTALLKDPHPNVVCQAYYALGQRRSPNAINPILRQLKTSDHWYTQWYGYRALRRLGWRQTRSD